MINMAGSISFPQFSSVRCLMMPFIQGDPDSLPSEYHGYRDIISNVYHSKGDIGFLTIDESAVKAGAPHRGARAKYGRAIHTEAGRDPNKLYCWGGGHWGGGNAQTPNVTLDRDVKILLSSNLDDSCAVWNKEHEETSIDGDIGHASGLYPYEQALLLKAGEVCEIGILTPHESLPAKQNFNRQFLRIISSGVHGRESYFTENPLLPRELFS